MLITKILKKLWKNKQKQRKKKAQRRMRRFFRKVFGFMTLLGLAASGTYVTWLNRNLIKDKLLTRLNLKKA